MRKAPAPRPSPRRRQNATPRGRSVHAARRTFAALTATCCLCVLFAGPAGAVTNHTLVVQTAGSGTGAENARGSVTSSPGGINCHKQADGDNQGNCSNEFEAGTEVTLTATPNSANTRAGISGGGCFAALGAVGEPVSCTTTMNRAKTVKATFNRPAPPLLTVTTRGAGTGAADATGTATSSPGDISCARTGGLDNQGDCTDSFSPGTLVTVTATPTSSATRASLGGACTAAAGAIGESVSCTVTMSAARTVRATFSKPAPFTLTASTLGSGADSESAEGTITTDPGGISCSRTAGEDNLGDCTQAYDPLTVVTVTATPTSANTRAAIFGGCSAPLGSAGQAVSCTLTMSQARSVTAVFTKPLPLLLSVSTLGFGAGVDDATGTVTSSPEGISCSRTGGENNIGDCSQSYEALQVVTLTATPTSADTKAQMAGGGCTAPQGAAGEAVECTVTMDQVRAVIAVFTKPAPAP